MQNQRQTEIQKDGRTKQRMSMIFHISRNILTLRTPKVINIIGNNFSTVNFYIKRKEKPCDYAEEY